jgi:hypothetical protein
MAGETSRPNYFILLGLDPKAPWDEKKFQEAFKAKKTEWSRLSVSAGKKAIEAQQNRERLPHIEEVMGNQKSREAEAADALKRQKEAGDAIREQFEERLRLIEARGYIEKSAFDKLVDEFKDLYDEKEIRSRLKVEIRDDPTRSGSQAGQALDPSVIKIIEELLKSQGIADLYQILEVKSNAPSEVLCRAADKLYHDMTIRQPKTNEVTTKSDLAGRAKDIFQSTDKRTAYDESLRQQAWNELLKPINESMKLQSVKTLSKGEVEYFLQRAAEKGWSKKQALDKLVEYARQQNWYVELPTIDQNPQQRCGNCGFSNSKQHQFCRKCNKPLLIQCPDCNEQVPSDEIGCSRCGFPVGNVFWIDEVLIECEGLLKREEVTTADERLSTVERSWQPKNADVRAQRIKNYRDKIRALMQKQQKYKDQLRQMIEQRRFHAAKQYLVTLPARLGEEVAEQKKLIEERLARAQELVKQAQSSSSHTDRKVELCLQALQICADAEEARRLLRATPPAPPSNVQAKVHGTVVSLSWDASASRNVSYKIVRKSRSRPSSVTDGILLDTITGRSYDDAQPENGVPLFYAIFSAYDEIISTQSTVLSHPVLLARNVSNVTVFVDDHLIDLRWLLPEHTHDVVVVRKSGSPPTSLRDGTPLSLTDKSRLMDRAVQNDQRYYYGIYCQYQDYEQRIISSSGVVKDGIPEAPPTAITELDIQSERGPHGYEVRLNWTSPTKGQVKVLKAAHSSSLKPHDRIPSNELKKHGTVLQGQANTLTDRLDKPGIVYYTPVVIFQNHAYIGKIHRHVCVEDVTNLEVENLGNVLRLQWTWPGNCQEALVCFDSAQWPTPNQATANVLKVTRSEYEYRGYYDIRGATNTEYYIVVAAVIQQGNEKITANGARRRIRLASKVVLSYEIKQARGLFGPKQCMLHLSVRSPGEIPTLLLVNKQGNLPIMKTEGEILFRLSGPVHIEDHKVIPLPDKARPPRTFAKLYLEDDTYYNEVIIHHPSEDKLRLS